MKKYTKAQKKVWSKNQNEITKGLVSSLYKLANELVLDVDKLREFARQWTGGFYNYSMGNMMLILWQLPTATLCAGYNDWISKYNRYVKKHTCADRDNCDCGQTGLSILAPVLLKRVEIDDDGDEVEQIVRRYRVVKTFDISQTDGEEINVGCEDLVTGEANFQSITSHFPEYPLKLTGKGQSLGSTDGKSIKVSQGKEASMVATFLHEVGHIRLGHLDNNVRSSENITHDIAELEAEAVSYLVCCVLGVQNERSKLYIGNWHGTVDKLTNQGTRILKTAESIVKTILA